MTVESGIYWTEIAIFANLIVIQKKIDWLWINNKNHWNWYHRAFVHCGRRQGGAAAFFRRCGPAAAHRLAGLRHRNAGRSWNGSWNCRRRCCRRWRRPWYSTLRLERKVKWKLQFKRQRCHVVTFMRCRTSSEMRRRSSSCESPSSGRAQSLSSMMISRPSRVTRISRAQRSRPPNCSATESIHDRYFSVIGVCSSMAEPMFVFQLPEIDLRLCMVNDY